MTSLAELVDKLVAGGMSAGAAAELVAAAIASDASKQLATTIEARRAKDRERKRRKRELSAECPRNSADTPPASFPLNNPLPSPPEETGGGGGRAREAGGFVLTPEALELALELAEIAGHDRNFLPTRWIGEGPAVWVQLGLNAGWKPAVMREAARAVMRRKRDGPPFSIQYFAKVFERAHAAPDFTFPQVSMGVVSHSGEVIDAKAQFRPHPAHNWQGRRDNAHAALAELRDSIAKHERSSPGGGERD